MAKLDKITNVELYVGYVDHQSVIDGFTIGKYLKDQNITYSLMNYPEADRNASLFENLSTWTFGEDFRQYTFNNFPLVIWTEWYDDYGVYREVTQTLDEMKASNLIKFKDLIKYQ